MFRPWINTSNEILNHELSTAINNMNLPEMTKFISHIKHLDDFLKIDSNFPLCSIVLRSSHQIFHNICATRSDKELIDCLLYIAPEKDLRWATSIVNLVSDLSTDILNKIISIADSNPMLVGLLMRRGLQVLNLKCFNSENLHFNYIKEILDYFPDMVNDLCTYLWSFHKFYPNLIKYCLSRGGQFPEDIFKVVCYDSNDRIIVLLELGLPITVKFIKKILTVDNKSPILQTVLEKYRFQFDEYNINDNYGSELSCKAIEVLEKKKAFLNITTFKTLTQTSRNAINVVALDKSIFNSSMEKCKLAYHHFEKMCQTFDVDDRWPIEFWKWHLDINLQEPTRPSLLLKILDHKNASSSSIRTIIERSKHLPEDTLHYFISKKWVDVIKSYCKAGHPVDNIIEDHTPLSYMFSQKTTHSTNAETLVEHGASVAKIKNLEENITKYPCIIDWYKYVDDFPSLNFLIHGKRAIYYIYENIPSKTPDMILKHQYFNTEFLIECATQHPPTFLSMIKYSPPGVKENLFCKILSKAIALAEDDFLKILTSMLTLGFNFNAHAHGENIVGRLLDSVHVEAILYLLCYGIECLPKPIKMCRGLVGKAIKNHETNNSVFSYDLYKYYPETIKSNIWTLLLVIHRLKLAPNYVPRPIFNLIVYKLTMYKFQI